MTIYYHYDIIINMIIKGGNTSEKKCITITIVTFVALAALTLVLPQEIPLHFGVSGSDSVADKYFIVCSCTRNPFLGN